MGRKARPLYVKGTMSYRPDLVGCERALAATFDPHVSRKLIRIAHARIQTYGSARKILRPGRRYLTSPEFHWFPCVEVTPVCGGAAVLPPPTYVWNADWDAEFQVRGLEAESPAMQRS